MEKGFKIVTSEYCKTGMYITVSNYSSLNEILMCRYETKREALEEKDHYDVGIWQPKGTKQKYS